MAADEVDPCVVYRLTGSHLEYALWTLPDGRRALAMFLLADTARSYVESAKLGEGWRIVRPRKADLMEILRQCLEAGISSAVMDMKPERDELIFDIAQVLAAERDSKDVKE